MANYDEIKLRLHCISGEELVGTLYIHVDLSLTFTVFGTLTVIA